jgi:hypothetical protein
VTGEEDTTSRYACRGPVGPGAASHYTDIDISARVTHRSKQVCYPHLQEGVSETRDRTQLSPKSAIVRVVQFVWILAVAAGSIVSYTGNATPYVEPSQLPAGGTADAEMYMFGTILVVGFGGAVAIALAAGDQWQKMNDKTDLTLTDSGVTGRGTYVGTINGREVRARTERRKTGSGTEGGSNRTTYTITEADLDSSLNEGILLRRVTDTEDREGERSYRRRTAQPG